MNNPGKDRTDVCFLKKMDFFFGQNHTHIIIIIILFSNSSSDTSRNKSSTKMKNPTNIPF